VLFVDVLGESGDGISDLFFFSCRVSEFFFFVFFRPRSFLSLRVVFSPQQRPGPSRADPPLVAAASLLLERGMVVSPFLLGFISGFFLLLPRV